MNLNSTAALTKAQVTIMSLGLEILGNRLSNGFQIGLEPVEGTDAERATHVTFNTMRNGKPVKDDAARDELTAIIGRVVSGRHRSEATMITIDGLKIALTEEAKKAIAEAKERVERYREAKKGSAHRPAKAPGGPELAKAKADKAAQAPPEPADTKDTEGEEGSGTDQTTA